MPRQPSSPISPSHLKQKTLLGFFQPASTQKKTQGGVSAFKGEGSTSKVAPTKRTRLAREKPSHTTKRGRKVISVLYSDSDNDEPAQAESGSESSDFRAIEFNEPSTGANSVAEEDDDGWEGVKSYSGAVAMADDLSWK